MKLAPFSLNDQLIVEPYKHGQGLQSEIKNGLAFVKQKIDLIGLTLLAEARLSDGNYLPVGTVVYIPEDVLNLNTSQWAKNVRKCAALGDKEFIVVDKKHVVLIDTKEELK